MKVTIGKYINHFSTYQLAETICFWAKENDKGELPDYVDKLGDFLTYGFNKVHDVDFNEWIINPNYKNPNQKNETWLVSALQKLNDKRKRKISVHIDEWDTYSLDHTLALIILPCLKQLNATKNGAPNVDNEDVPKDLQASAEELAQHKKNGETDDNYFKRWDYVLSEMIYAFEMLVECDDVNNRQNNDRIDNGLRLFGKYYRALWD